MMGGGHDSSTQWSLSSHPPSSGSSSDIIPPSPEDPAMIHPPFCITSGHMVTQLCWGSVMQPTCPHLTPDHGATRAPHHAVLPSTLPLPRDLAPCLGTR